MQALSMPRPHLIRQAPGRRPPCPPVASGPWTARSEIVLHTGSRGGRHGAPCRRQVAAGLALGEQCWPRVPPSPIIIPGCRAERPWPGPTAWPRGPAPWSTARLPGAARPRPAKLPGGPAYFHAFVGDLCAPGTALPAHSGQAGEDPAAPPPAPLAGVMRCFNETATGRHPQDLHEPKLTGPRGTRLDPATVPLPIPARPLEQQRPGRGPSPKQIIDRASHRASPLRRKPLTRQRARLFPPGFSVQISRGPSSPFCLLGLRLQP